MTTPIEPSKGSQMDTELEAKVTFWIAARDREQRKGNKALAERIGNWLYAARIILHLQGETELASRIYNASE